jgi:DNA-binding response OmpR family regulator
MDILLLEDDKALHKAIKRILEIDGHRVSSFYAGDEVVDTEDGYNYDLYLLDINVPGINGLDLLNLIYSYNPLSKVIMISANIDLASIKKAYDLGCMDYLKKPFHIEELRLKINKYQTQSTSLLDTLSIKPDATLTKKEKTFLILLLEHRGSLVSYDMIALKLYRDTPSYIDPLRTLVRRVRAKLSHDSIECIKNEGYIIR